MPYVWSKNRKLGVLGSVYSEILRGDDGVSQRAKNWRATMRVPRIPTPENTILPSLTVSLDSSALISWNRSLRRDSCLASISLRRSPIPRRKSSLVARKSSFVANSFKLTSKTSDKTSASASACADGTPTALSRLAILSVSKAGSAINQFSLSKILSQQPLTPSEDEAYIAAQVLKTPQRAAKSPRQSAAFISPVGFAQWAGVRLIQDPKGKYARRLVAVFSACPPPAENRGLSLSTRSKAMSASAQGTSVPSIFSFEEKPLRVIVIDGEPWFVAADVCAALEISNPSMALRVLDDDEKALSLIEGLSKLVGGNEQVNIINDSGLYTLTLRCRDAVKKGSLPHRFRKKVTAEILPAIRKTGRYEAASSEVTKAQLKDAFRNARWLARYRDGELRFESLPSNVFVTTPQEYISVLRAPHIFPAVCLPDVLAACAKRMEAIVEDGRTVP